MSHSLKAEAAGCRVTKSDTQLVTGSVICSATYGIYGACFSSLGAALPELADNMHKSSGDFGISFTTRGVGYLIGTLISSYFLLDNPYMSKPFIACVFLVLNGIALVFVSGSTSFIFVMVLFSVQGIGFGGIDMMCNCAVPELWGLRAQPWMQAMHTCFGVGAIVGPLLVGLVGYRLTFIIIAIVSILPMVGLCTGYICGLQKNERSGRLLSQASDVSSMVGAAKPGNDSVNVPFDSTSHPSLEDGDAHQTPNTQKSFNHSHNSHTGKVLAQQVSSARRYSNASHKTTSSKHSKYSNLSNGRLADPLHTKAPSVTPSGMPRKEYLLPASIKYLTALFYFVYMGYETGYAGWVSSYALTIGVTESNADAAFLPSVYWAAITFGRLLAIFVAIYLTATQMIRIKLFLCIVFGVVMLLISHTNYTNLTVATALFGFAVSSIFPLAMTVVTDYGFNMDSTATSMFMIGTTTGESVLPVLIGLFMQYEGYYTFPIIMLVCSSILVSIYFTVNWLGHCKQYFIETVTLNSLQSHNSSSNLLDNSHLADNNDAFIVNASHVRSGNGNTMNNESTNPLGMFASNDNNE